MACGSKVCITFTDKKSIKLDLTYEGEYDELCVYYAGSMVESEGVTYVALMYTPKRTKPSKENKEFWLPIGIGYDLIEKVKGE